MKTKTIHRTIRRSAGEKIFDVFNICFMILLMIICIYPFWYVICASFSKASLLMGHPGILFKPLGFTTEAYKKVFSDSRIWIGYANTIFYVVAGTLINLVMTVLGAYFLSRKDVPGQKVSTVLIMFTMYFSGGLIPQFLNIQQLGLYDTRLAILLPGAVSTFNLIIMRTAMASIDISLEESARLDGANHFTILSRIMVPLTKPTMAVLVLYYGVGHWNSWFSAMIYLDDHNKEPLQLVIRQILILSSGLSGMGDSDTELIAESIKYATIVVATVPILVLYPFLQKYFVKGMMVGSVKG